MEFAPLDSKWWQKEKVNWKIAEYLLKKQGVREFVLAGGVALNWRV